MQSENRFFDDFVKMVNGAAGTFAGMAREGESSVKERAKTWIGGLDFVSRDEFEVVKTMAAQAREELEALKAEIAALKGVSASAAPPTPAAGAPAPAASGVTFPE